MNEVGQALAEAHRREWAYVVAAAVRAAGDIGVAEECAQEAFVAALDQWGRDGIPRNPGGWLATTARRRAIDHVRRSVALRGKLPLLVEPDTAHEEPAEDEDPVIPDDRLRLVFTCCHPALSRDAQVALTLRLVCGVTTPQVARLFLVSEPTMAARVTRAKKKIAAARIPYRTPPEHELPDRLDAVLTVVHLLYTTGHTAVDGDSLVRTDLVARAVDLARLLHALMPDEREVRGLLALLLLGVARGATRTDDRGALVLLEDQDRSLWDRTLIEEGRRLVVEALRGPGAGRFALQAAIAAVHAEAPAYAATDWPEIRDLYDELLRVWPSPVVSLNRAVAVAMVDGPAVALAAVDGLAGDPRLAAYPYLPATRADLLRRLGRPAEARQAYLAAVALAANAAERAFLERRAAEVAGG